MKMRRLKIFICVLLSMFILSECTILQVITNEESTSTRRELSLERDETLRKFEILAGFKPSYTPYYYNQLTMDEKLIYISLYNAEKFHLPKAYVLSNKIIEVENAYNALLQDNPERICISPLSVMWYNIEDDYISVTYDFTYEQCREMRNATAAVCNEVILGFTPEMTDYDKELAVHDYIVKNCYYDYAAVDDNANLYKSAHMAYGALVEGKAVCEGYARAMSLILNECRINNYFVYGNSGEGENRELINHIWNIVEIDGKRYHVDSTHDDVYDGEDNRISHVYLNLPTNEISSDHFSITIDTEYCEHTEANFFVKSNSLLNGWGSVEKEQMANIFAAAVAKKERVVECKFSAEDSYDSALYTLKNSYSFWNIIERAESISGVDIKDELSYIENPEQRVIIFEIDY